MRALTKLRYWLEIIKDHMNESIGVIGLGNAGLALAGALGRHYRVHG